MACKQLLQLVDALGPARLHATEHARCKRNEANGVRLQDKRGLAALFGEGDGRLALEQVLAIVVDRDVGEYEPLWLGHRKEYTFHRIVRAVRSAHHDPQASALAHVEF